MTALSDTDFKRRYPSHLKHLRLKDLQPRTIEAYARATRRIGANSDHPIDDLSETLLTDYFTELRASHSWSPVMLDLYGLELYYTHVLHTWRRADTPATGRTYGAGTEDRLPQAAATR